MPRSISFSWHLTGKLPQTEHVPSLTEQTLNVRIWLNRNDEIMVILFFHDVTFDDRAVAVGAAAPDDNDNDDDDDVDDDDDDGDGD
ncbi:unnamed protein product [Echinostoma caproni]|uniref:Uncharacterized protein n=1 Tax=Echinostoma caproni TaxID=27848 RepID=A0A183AFB7_9TREM|nr:unnamed protein product [Echinostoma caproni]